MNFQMRSGAEIALPCGLIVQKAMIKGASRLWFLSLWLVLLLAPVKSLHAALQFDVFLGYDGIVPEASWFPVVCEIKNDGASFNGIVELTSTDANQGQSRRALVELPTGTLKRLVI